MVAQVGALCPADRLMTASEVSVLCPTPHRGAVAAREIPAAGLPWSAFLGRTDQTVMTRSGHGRRIVAGQGRRGEDGVTCESRQCWQRWG